MDDKGKLNGTCNLSSCKTGYPARWYNYGSYAHYCEACAGRLNEDLYNRYEALRLFGHALCLEVTDKKEEIPEHEDYDIEDLTHG